MPYIGKKQQENIDNHGFCLNATSTIGNLNCVITKAILKYIDIQESHNRPVNYELYNSMIGVLECVKQELYRKVIAKYEDAKCSLNGDVFK